MQCLLLFIAGNIPLREDVRTSEHKIVCLIYKKWYQTCFGIDRINFVVISLS